MHTGALRYLYEQQTQTASAWVLRLWSVLLPHVLTFRHS
jgi:hypothetical protein